MIPGAVPIIMANRQGERPLPALDPDPPVLPAHQSVGAQFSVVLHEAPGREAALRGLLAEAGPDAQVIRVGNPLRAPLTIERILIQTGLVEAGLLTDAEAGQAMQQLLQRRGSRTMLVIDQAETLSQPALQAIARLAPPATARAADHAEAPHIVLAGRPAFAELVRATPDVGPIRDALPRLPGLLQAEPSAGALPQVDDPPPAAPQPLPPPPAPGVPSGALPESASWFRGVSADTEAASSAEQVPAPVPIPARLQARQVFWTLLLFFLAGLGAVLGTAVLLQR